MATIEEALATAESLQRAGNLLEAARVCELIAAAEPHYFPAWHLLGLIAHQARRPELAAAYFARAVELRPDLPEAHNNLGTAFLDQLKFDEAAICYRRAVELRPNYAEAHANLAGTLQHRGNLAEAVASYRRSIELNPGDSETHNNLGATLYALGKLAEAEASYREALRHKADNAEAISNLGNILFDRGRISEAADCYQSALRLKPDYVVGWFNLGNALRSQGKPWEAIECYRRAIELRPEFVEAHSNLGNALADDQGRSADAVGSYRRAVQLRPDFAEGHNNLGTVLVELGELEEGAACFQRALELRPDYADARHNRSQLLMLRGDFECGWPEYEWRWKRVPARIFQQPQWSGERLEGRTILLHAEQGLGDTFQFIRYARLVKERGGKVLVECQRPLARVLAQGHGIDLLVARGDELPPFDVQIPLLSLPLILKTTLETIPTNVPYLFADPDLVLQWRARLAGFDEVAQTRANPRRNFRIGVNWAGRTIPGPHKRRDIPVEHFERLAAVPGVRLVSLQKGRPSKVQGPESKLEEVAAIIDFHEELDAAHGAFMDTAAIMMNLDLVITSDTSVAHLAGALGVPVWVALPFVPDWRWMLERSESPWYPTMRLFRQKSYGDWAGVFREIEAELRKRVETEGRRKAER